MRKGFTVMELLSILAILFSILIPIITVVRYHKQVERGVQIGEMVHHQGVSSVVTDVNGLFISIILPNGRTEKIHWADFNDKERERIIKENIWEESETPHLVSPSDHVIKEPSNPTVVFSFSKGDIVRHKLNGWRGMVVSVEGNTATVRFQVGSNFQTVEGIILVNKNSWKIMKYVV